MQMGSLLSAGSPSGPIQSSKGSVRREHHFEGYMLGDPGRRPGGLPPPPQRVSGSEPKDPHVGESTWRDMHTVTHQPPKGADDDLWGDGQRACPGP